MNNTTTTETKTETAAAYNARTYDERIEKSRQIIIQISRADEWARARWGVKEMVLLAGREDADVGVMFNCNKRIKITINLDAASDTYTVEIGRMKGRFDYVKHYECSDVYADVLAGVIDRAFSKAFGSL